jgi:6-phosphofructokinase 2
VDPGGGGINVSRAIKLLGGRSTALVAIGGASGARLLELLTKEGIATIGFQGPGETRLSLSVTERETNDQYRFVLPGPTGASATWTARSTRSTRRRDRTRSSCCRAASRRAWPRTFPRSLRAMWPNARRG